MNIDTATPMMPPATGSPAQAVAESLAWTIGDGSPVRSVVANGPSSVTLTMAGEDAEASRWMADLATEGLRQAIDGVRLVFVDEQGIPGSPQGFSGDELADLYFELPGVQEYGHVSWDLNGDGSTDPGEEAHVIRASHESSERLSRLLPERLGEIPVIFTQRDF